MKKVASKGYTLKVVSWENDGDNYKTEKYTTEDKELAKELVNLCEELFKSGKGIGNFNDGEEEKAMKIVIPYMKKHPKLYEGRKIEDDKELYDICMDLAYELMGSSEYYICRVMESVTVTYLEEDVFAKEVKF